MNARYSPEACSRARLSVPTIPLCSLRINVTSENCPINSAVRSVDPSSTAMTSPAGNSLCPDAPQCLGDVALAIVHGHQYADIGKEGNE